MKERYEVAEIEVTVFATEDVITASGEVLPTLPPIENVED